MTSRTILKKVLSSLTVGGLMVSILSANALTVSPARAELTADPGQAISESFLVINEQDAEQTYYTSVENFEAQGETGTPNFTTSKEGLPSWVQVQDKITLKKGERAKIQYTISVPQNADAGGHFAAIFLSTVPPSTKEGEVSVGAKVGMLILLKVTGDVKEQGGLLTFKVKEDKKTLTSLPVDFSYRFKNDGNDKVMPAGSIVINNTFGMEVARIDANKSLGNVLPGSIRGFEARFGDTEAPSLAAPFFEQVKFQKDNFALGMYTANLGLTFGEKGTANSALTFFIIPWQLISIVLVIVIGIFLLLAIALKRYNKWIIKQARAAAKQ
jgi:hypothetical protein